MKKTLREIINFLLKVDEIHGPTLDLALCTNDSDLSPVFHYLKIVCTKMHGNEFE